MEKTTNNSCCEQQDQPQTESALNLVLDQNTYKDYTNLLESAKHFDCIDTDKDGILKPVELVDSDHPLANDILQNYKNIDNADGEAAGVTRADLQRKLQNSLNDLPLNNDLTFDNDDIRMLAHAGKDGKLSVLNIQDKAKRTELDFHDGELDFNAPDPATQEHCDSNECFPSGDEDSCCDDSGSEATDSKGDAKGADSGVEGTADDDCCDDEACADETKTEVQE